MSHQRAGRRDCLTVWRLVFAPLANGFALQI
jgi:hypothetical protein